MKKRKTKSFPEFFPIEKLQEKKEDNLEELEKSGNEGDILRLVAKCEKLVAELKNSGPSDGVGEVLSLLAKLKMLLLFMFKKKQRKLLDLHWEQICKENEEYSRRMNEQREYFKKIDNNQTLKKENRK